MAVKVLDYIFLGRPLLLIPAWTIYLHVQAVCHPADSDPGSVVHHIGSLAVLSLIFAGTYIVNQIFDIASDRINDKLYLLPRGIITVPAAWIAYVAVTACGLIVAIFISQHLLVIALLIVSLGLFYSLPGVRLKDRAMAGLLANAIAYGVLIPAAASPEAVVESTGLAAAAYFLAIAVGYILTTIPDFEGDTQSGKRTVAVVLHPERALSLALAVDVATLAVSISAGNTELAIVAGVTLCMLIALTIWYRRPLLLLSCKLPILLLTIATIWHFPAYGILLILTIVLTRLYYKYRFGVVYPKLS